MKRFFILGVTGSIGRQAIEVLRTLNNYKIEAISFGSNIEEAKKVIEEFKPRLVCAKEKADADKVKELYPDILTTYGDAGLSEVSCFDESLDKNDCYVLNAVVGMVGLKSTIDAIKMGRTILLANKETLVVGGELIEKLKEKYDVKLIPIDSEHSAIMQCLKGYERCDVDKLIITASGGAFRNLNRSELENVTIDDALKHPNWNMGKKITVDCATMVNKGLEVMEAHFLFGFDYDHIDTILHYESIVHSMVKFKDGSILAQMGKPDMRLPIQYAITYPKREEFKLDSALNLTKASLSFKEMDFNRYPMLSLAYKVGKAGGIMPTVYNSANEASVSLFINKKIKFLDIEKIIFMMCDKYYLSNIKDYDIEYIINLDKEIKEYIISNYQDLLK
ncbi:MAG: 1-deoxy-D-xylulose-5-phosphate reductoisomerase [Bacilli bacterium]|nr:1-deoxy-D-xylulose-5-phosphate reductoisomerase [Bacilli bacterium]